MKKLSIIAIAFLVVALVLTSCATKSQGGDILVSWYDGTKLLKEEYVPAGTKLQSWTPEKEGATFMAWYAEASKIIVCRWLYRGHFASIHHRAKVFV